MTDSQRGATKPRQTVAVVGVGSVGGVFASELLLADQHDVILCARRPFTGLTVTSSTVAAEHPDVVAVTDPAVLEDTVDWVLLVTKAHQTVGAKPWLDVLCGPSTRVVVVQNGCEQHERGTGVAPQSTVLPAVVYCGASVDAPGRIMHTERCQLIVPDDANGNDLAGLFEGTRAQIDASETFSLELFRKVMVNVIVNGTCAVAVQPAAVFEREEIRALGRAMAAEVVAVASAEGVTQAEELSEMATKIVEGFPPTLRPSMLQDRQAGRRLEHDAIYGGVLRLAERHGIATPSVAAMHALLCAVDGSD